MSDQHIFISHTTKDDTFVQELRAALEASGLRTWVDSRELIAGNKLAPEIEQAIKDARQFIVVLSPNTVNSPWVRKEIQQALKVEQGRKDERYRVIPLLLPGIEPSALALWFDEEPVGVKITIEPGGLSVALPNLLAALGERLPDDFKPSEPVDSQPVEELILKLSNPSLALREGKQLLNATAALLYKTATPTARDVESEPFEFSAPLGPIEIDDLRW